MKIGDIVIYNSKSYGALKAVIVDTSLPEEYRKSIKTLNLEDKERIVIEIIDEDFPAGYRFESYKPRFSGRYSIPPKELVFLTGENISEDGVELSEFRLEAISLIRECIKTRFEIEKISL